MRVSLTTAANTQLSVQSRPVHPEFGREVDTNRLAWSYAGRLPVDVMTTLEVLQS